MEIKDIRLSMKGQIRFWILCSLILVLPVACQKTQEFNQTDNPTFIRVYGTGEAGYISSIQELAEGHILGIGGNENTPGYRRYLLDAYGNKIEVKVENDFGLSFPTSQKLSSGEIILADRFTPTIQKYSATGQLIFSKQFNATPTYGQYSSLVQSPDGTLLIGFSSGAGPKDETRIIQIDKDGNTINNKIINLPSGRRILTCSILGSDGTRVAISGNTFAKAVGWRYTDRWKHFEAIYNMSTNQIEKEVYYDLYDNSEEDGVVATTSFQDGTFASLVSSANLNEVLPRREFELFKSDQDLNLIWRKRYDIGAIITYPWSITVTKKGGLLVYGYCITSATYQTYGFMLLLNANGEILSKHIYSFSQNMALLAGTESEDGSLIFGGAGLGFGQGKDSGSPLIFKTDALGNIE